MLKVKNTKGQRIRMPESNPLSSSLLPEGGLCSCPPAAAGPTAPPRDGGATWSARTGTLQVPGSPGSAAETLPSPPLPCQDYKRLFFRHPLGNQLTRGSNEAGVGAARAARRSGVSSSFRKVCSANSNGQSGPFCAGEFFSSSLRD